MNKLGVYGIDITRILEGKVRTWMAKGANTEWRIGDRLHWDWSNLREISEE